jgi:hypothetical protein
LLTAPQITQRRLRRPTIDLRDTKKFSGSHDDAFLVVGSFSVPFVILSAAKDLSFWGLRPR